MCQSEPTNTGKRRRDWNSARPNQRPTVEASESPPNYIPLTSTNTSNWSNNRIRLNIDLYHRSFTALVDTGSVRSYISPVVAEYCKQMGNVPTTAKQEMQAELANGTLVNITEEYNIQGQLLSTNVAANFLLMPSLTVDCVLGMDFLTEYNCTIDIGTKQITINPKTDRVYPTLTIEPITPPSSCLTELQQNEVTDVIEDIILCPWYTRKFQEVEQDPDKNSDYCIKDGKLYRHFFDRYDFTEPELADPWKLCIPTPRRCEILQEGHDQPTAGHLGVAKTIARIARHYYWPGMFREIANYEIGRAHV